MKRLLESLRSRLVPVAVYASGYALALYALALLTGALLDWGRNG